MLPGYDADLVLVDLEREYEIRDADVLSLTGWSPYAGRKFRGKPVRTIVRGKTVYLDGKVIGDKGWGKQADAQLSAANALGRRETRVREGSTSSSSRIRDPPRSRASSSRPFRS